MPPKWPITAREADAIEAALRVVPQDVPAIALRFKRSEGTIRKLGESRGVCKRKHRNATSCGSSIRTNANENSVLNQDTNRFPVDMSGKTLGDQSIAGA